MKALRQCSVPIRVPIQRPTLRLSMHIGLGESLQYEKLHFYDVSSFFILFYAFAISISGPF